VHDGKNRRKTRRLLTSDSSHESKSLISKAVAMQAVRCGCYWRCRPTVSWPRLKTYVSGQPHVPKVYWRG